MIAATRLLEDLPLDERFESSPPPNLRPLLDIPLNHVREAIALVTDYELTQMDNDGLMSLILDTQLPADAVSAQVAFACRAASLHQMSRQQLLKLATDARNFCQR